MLTREGFVAADMSAQSTLQRSSWKAEAIRKGNLKISGPIPITEDTPLNEDEEREYAETGALSPVQPQDDKLDQTPQTPPLPPAPPHLVSVSASVSNPSPEQTPLNSHPVQGQLQQEEIPSLRQPSRSPPRPLQVNVMARESAIEPALYTPQTPFRSTPESTTKSAQKKKRKSGLRNVFRKMFGRKSKDDLEDEEPVHRGHSYHHSDPGMLRQSPPREQQTPSGPRISELPVKELQPLHPLGQHLPFPMNVNAPQASPPREYLAFDMQRTDIGRRRATLPSVPSGTVQRHSFDEPRGRLPIWDERQDEDQIPSPGIGIALSSPTQATTPVASKRRSRSVDGLRELGRDRGSIDRRRSAEIRYWRQSYADASIHSRPQTAKTMEALRNVQTQEPTITEPDDEVLEMSATLVHADEPSPSPNEHREERDLQPSVSAFNFGLKSAFSDDDTAPSELPPMSPPEGTKDRLSIEDRVTTLEGSFQTLELTMRRMSSRNNRQTIILSDAPRNLRSRERNRSSQSGSTSSDHLPNYQSSNDTLKSTPSSPVLTRPSGVEGSEGGAEKVISQLYEALKYERTSRKQLEQRVHTLQHDIADLHALVNKLIVSATATSPSYPTPSPDTLITSTEERMLTPRAARTEFGTHGASDIRESIVSKFSRTDSEESRRGGWGGSPDDPVASPDVWATPKEEGFMGDANGSGFFGRERSRSDSKKQAMEGGMI